MFHFKKHRVLTLAKHWLDWDDYLAPSIALLIEWGVRIVIESTNSDRKILPISHLSLFFFSFLFWETFSFVSFLFFFSFLRNFLICLLVEWDMQNLISFTFTIEFLFSSNFKYYCGGVKPGPMRWAQEQRFHQQHARGEEIIENRCN